MNEVPWITLVDTEDPGEDLHDDLDLIVPELALRWIAHGHLYPDMWGMPRRWHAVSDNPYERIYRRGDKDDGAKAAEAMASAIMEQAVLTGRLRCAWAQRLDVEEEQGDGRRYRLRSQLELLVVDPEVFATGAWVSGWHKYGYFLRRSDGLEVSCFEFIWSEVRALRRPAQPAQPSIREFVESVMESKRSDERPKLALIPSEPGASGVELGSLMQPAAPIRRSGAKPKNGRGPEVRLTLHLASLPLNELEALRVKALGDLLLSFYTDDDDAKPDSSNAEKRASSIRRAVLAERPTTTSEEAIAPARD